MKQKNKNFTIVCENCGGRHTLEHKHSMSNGPIKIRNCEYFDCPMWLEIECSCGNKIGET